VRELLLGGRTIDQPTLIRFYVLHVIVLAGALGVLFNRTNFVEINNIFGTGAYPGNPLPTFGQFNQAGAPLQAQFAAKLYF
jgi:quinol-cytochrome oxidoreductase complex cytochrome b subunit